MCREGVRSQCKKKRLADEEKQTRGGGRQGKVKSKGNCSNDKGMNKGRYTDGRFFFLLFCLCCLCC